MTRDILKQPRPITLLDSYFMDVLRLLAAIGVMIVHAYEMWFPAKAGIAAKWGHFAVIIFFVLSGYVIAFTTENKNRGALQYAQARLSRLYSVLLPAIVITFIIEAFIMNRYPAVHHMYDRGSMFIRYMASGLFLNEVWFFSMAPPINGPLWSLSYEFWYYVVFGVFFFRKRFRAFAVIAVITLLVAGPKILLMMPIWLMGVAIYKLQKLKINNVVSWLLILLSWSAALVINIYGGGIPLKLGTPPLFFGAQFISDWLIGVFVSFSIYVLPNWRNTNITGMLQRKGTYFYIRKAADLTFPIYILHFPLLVLFNALVGIQTENPIQLFIALLVVVFTCGITGLFLDRFRKKWTDAFGWILKSCKARFGHYIVKE